MAIADDTVAYLREHCLVPIAWRTRRKRMA